MKLKLPAPSDEELQRSQRCQQIIVEEIHRHQRPMNFERYMQICLYASQIGYYESGSDIFGPQGDFTTSPERSEFFAHAFAAHIKNIKAQIGDYSLIEVGAGSGKFAGDLIRALKHIACLPQRYYIVEKSSELKRRQKTYLAEYQSMCEIEWIEALATPIDCAIVIANEVLDALPVKLLSVERNKIYERCVNVGEDGELEFVQVEAEEPLFSLMQTMLPESVLNGGDGTYHCEVNLILNDFIQEIAAFVNKGIFFYIDYGYARHEYYHEQRTMGTLICHYRNSANQLALLWPGLQDISCNVDFTAVAEAGVECGLNVEIYSTQGNFLLASHTLENILADNQDPVKLQQQAEIKRLIMPAEMGERFQIILLSKNMALDCHSLTTRNMLHRL